MQTVQTTQTLQTPQRSRLGPRVTCDLDYLGLWLCLSFPFSYSSSSSHSLLHMPFLDHGGSVCKRRREPE